MCVSPCAVCEPSANNRLAAKKPNIRGVNYVVDFRDTDVDEEMDVHGGSKMPTNRFELPRACPNTWVDVSVGRPFDRPTGKESTDVVQDIRLLSGWGIRTASFGMAESHIGRMVLRVPHVFFRRGWDIR